MYGKRPISILRVAGTFVIALVITLSLSGLAYGASTSKTLSTNFTLVNLSAANRAVGTIQYLTDTGAEWTGVETSSKSFDLDPNGGSIQVRQYFSAMSAGRGSVVINSSAELGAVVQIQARGQVPTQGAYSGARQGSSKFYVPLVAKARATASGAANSQIIIQNADSGQVSVTVDFFPSPGISGSYQKTGINLAPGQSFYYDVADEPNLPSNWLGSAVVTALSNAKITVVSNFFTGSDPMQTFNGFAVEDVGTSWIVPTLFSRLPNGLNTVVTVQNLSGADIPANGVTLNCTTTKGNTPANLNIKNPTAIANNASYSFNPVTDTGAGRFEYAGWEGTCTVTSGSANVVVLIQLRFVNSPSGNIGSAAYEGLRSGGTDKKMFVPLVAKRLQNGFASVVALQNLSGSTATVNLFYVPALGGACPTSACDRNGDGQVTSADTITVSGLTIPGNSSIQRNHRLPAGTTDAEDTLPDRWEGSLRVESNQAIDGYVQLTYYLNVSGDQLMAHRAFTVP